MARIRTIKPAFFRSDDVRQLSYRARLTWIGLWTYVDDEGRGRDDARIIKGDLWALEDDVTWQDVEDDLTELSRSAHVVRYEVSGRRYLHIPTWLEHQVISRPTKSKFPDPEDGVTRTFPALTEDSMSDPGVLPAGSGTGNREREQGSGSGVAPQAAPAAPKSKRGSRIPDPFVVTPEMVAWAKDRVPGLDGAKSTEKFVNHFTSVPGAKGVKLDWIATWRNWLLGDYDKGQNMITGSARPAGGQYQPVAQIRNDSNRAAAMRAAEREASANHQEIAQ